MTTFSFHGLDFFKKFGLSDFTDKIHPVKAFRWMAFDKHRHILATVIETERLHRPPIFP